eukprot:CAMPEP_0172447808 /NCGR_PEP_ID=MMETSP1065-20121228/7010_1 /TAXON_ID=265537 /ORGANISM="Amphiprora paludosa, Strain CCMP125" /LENGTH=555 /DNA_ID=CAMNT_0013199179 /DNA_START=72 /DNA_END=1739 /DNA_ORIENTATION=-
MGQQLHEIVTPHDHDVLSGRGNFVNYHAGNEHFRSLVRKHKVAYVACPKQQKGKFSRLIVEEIRARNPPGRFLKQDPVTKLWHDIGEKKALDKTRQALREGAPDIMKEITGDEDEDPSSTPQGDMEESHSQTQKKGGAARTSNSPNEEHLQQSPPAVLSSSSNHGPQQQRMGRGGPVDGYGGDHSFEASTGFNPALGVGMGADPLVVSSNSNFSTQQQQRPSHISSMSNNNPDMLGQHGSQHSGGFGQQSDHGGMGGLGGSQHGPGGGGGYGGNSMGATPGLGTLADLRARMSQQHQQQRQFPAFNTAAVNMNATGMGGHMSSGGGAGAGSSLQNKLNSLQQLQQEMYLQQQQLQQQQQALMSEGGGGQFDFDPRPIAPGNEAHQVLPPVRSSMGFQQQTNQEPLKSAAPGREIEREASEKSLKMDALFDKAIHGETPEKEKMGGSTGSGMSISLGDINLDDDDGQNGSMAPPAPKTFNIQQAAAAQQSQNPDDLAERFSNSMRIKKQQDKGLDMSVGSLGDSGNLYNSNASMAFSEGSFGDVFDDNEKEILTAT